LFALVALPSFAEPIPSPPGHLLSDPHGAQEGLGLRHSLHIGTPMRMVTILGNFHTLIQIKSKIKLFNVFFGFDFFGQPS
jgi:hypothetical protein